MSGFNATQTEIRTREGPVFCFFVFSLLFFCVLENFIQWAGTSVMGCAGGSGGASAWMSVVLGERLTRMKGCERDAVQAPHCYFGRVNIVEAKGKFAM